MSAIANTLTAEERTRLSYTEQTIARGIASFVTVGTALLEIQQHRLYRETHATFAAYCKERWGMGRSNAYQAIEAAKVVGLLPIEAGQPPALPVDPQMSAMADKPETVPAPESERSVRPLTKLPKEKVAPVYKRAVEKAGGKAPSAKQVEEAVAEEQAEAAPEGAELPAADVPALAMNYADAAIGHLQRIHKDDPRRAEAFAWVRKWLNSREIEWEENE